MPSDQTTYAPEEALTLYRKHMPPEALAPGVPLIVREAIRAYTRQDTAYTRPSNLRPQLLALWTTIRGELALYGSGEACELPYKRLAELSGVGVNQIRRCITILAELGLLSIVGERHGSGNCRPSLIYDIDHLDLLRRSADQFVEACTWRGIRRVPQRAIGGDQLSLFDEPPSPEGAPSPGSDGPHHPGVISHHSGVTPPSPGSDGSSPPSPGSDGPHHPPDQALQSHEKSAPSPGSDGPHHPGVTAPSPGSDGRDLLDRQTDRQTDREERAGDGLTLSGEGLIAALRAVLPEVLHSMHPPAQPAFSPPGPLAAPEPPAGRAPLPAHPWDLWRATCPSDATEQNWNTLAWLASDHGWHWVGEAILVLSTGDDLRGVKSIKVKLDWWRMHDSYGSNNGTYHKRLAREAPATAPAASAVPDVTPTEAYLTEQGFQAAHEFAALDLAAVRAACEESFSLLDTREERERKIGRLVASWRRNAPVAAPEAPAAPEPETAGEAPEPPPAAPEAPAAPEEQGDELREMWRRVVGLLRMWGRTWEDLMLLDGCRLASLDEGQAIVVCPDSYRADQLGRHHNDELKQALSEVAGVQMRLQIVVRR